MNKKEASRKEDKLMDEKMNFPFSCSVKLDKSSINPSYVKAAIKKKEDFDSPHKLILPSSLPRNMVSG